MANSNAYTSGTPPMNPGDPVSARAMELMRQADQRALPQKGVGTLVRQTPSGTVVTVLPRWRTKVTERCFMFRDASTDREMLVAVNHGRVSGLVPVYNGQPIGFPPYPKIRVSSGTKLIYAKCQLAEATVVSVTLETGSDYNAPGNSDSVYHVALATVVMAEGGIPRISKVYDLRQGCVTVFKCKDHWTDYSV
jgi:hypothetical protein